MFAQFQADDRFTALQGTTEGETIIATNNLHEVLSDVRVRRAIMHAIDRQALIDGAVAGYGTPIGSHFAPHHPAYVDLTGTLPLRPRPKAKALLAEAGHGDGLELTLHLPPPSYARRGGEIVAAMLADVGITAKIENVEWAQWLENVYKKRQYAITIISHVEPMDHRDGFTPTPSYYMAVRQRRVSRDPRPVRGRDLEGGAVPRARGRAAAGGGRCGERLPVPARQARRRAEGADGHVAELAGVHQRRERTQVGVTGRGLCRGLPGTPCTAPLERAGHHTMPARAGAPSRGLGL